MLKQESQGLFVGLTTLDLIYLVQDLPAPNQKIVALADAIAAGGPATNAAIAFHHLGNNATVLSGIGTHPLSQLVLADLAEWQVESIDLTPTRSAPIPASSILVTEGTGDRAVISRNAVQFQAEATAIPKDMMQRIEQREIDMVLIDGHQRQVGKAIAQQAKAQQIPVILDGGSWKNGLETLLPFVDYAICSANFYPPGCTQTSQVLDYLRAFQIPHIAITRGGQPIQYLSQGICGTVAVNAIQPVDTLGAGDVFHGAFCHYCLRLDFGAALAEAGAIATQACQSFGTRQWMQA
ncbi:MAG: PfkB family carbohydrate kinase [Oculatellaceae cyanobacterium Prado106]|jgi:sugar/nucleoside kinase (ribokinase family)|nr:PfkB family carbohydrate kinase [Oculatellaceae cyanobacterium Prado106]